MVVSLGYLSEKQIKIDSNKITRLEEQGKTIVYVMIEDNLKGAIALADKIRPESKEAIAKLRDLGIKCMMITGDNRQVAKWVADEVGLDEYEVQH